MGGWDRNEAEELGNISSVDTVDEVSNITSVDTVDEISNVTSVDTVDDVTSVDTVDLVSRNAQTEIFGYNGTNWQNIRIDESTRSIQTISYPHHEIHGGSMFFAQRSDTLATNDVIAIALTTPDTTKEPHIEWSIYSAGQVKLEMLRNVTSYTGGTAYTPVNMNDRSANTSVCTVKVGSNGALSDALSITGGTAIELTQIGSGNRASGDGGSREEWILARDEITIFRVTAIGNNIVTSMHLHWYEHTPKAA